jgi:hypothetical protein
MSHGSIQFSCTFFAGKVNIINDHTNRPSGEAFLECLEEKDAM